MRRYPPTSDNSLTVFSAADRLLIDWARAHRKPGEVISIFHDRFGAVTLSVERPVRFVSTFHSQETALQLNSAEDSIPTGNILQSFPAVDLGLLRIPKAIDLFDLYLSRIAAGAHAHTRLAAGFMTRHFTPRLLEIAGRYAGSVRQTQAHKKARLLLLEEWKQGGGAQVTEKQLDYQGKTYRQLSGVFSANHIDFATQFLLDHWPPIPAPGSILDIACGNGIIGDQLLLRYPGSKLIATDDSILAVASAKRNLPADRSEVHYTHTLVDIADKSQDLIVTNPPFHFGYENNIDVSIALFGEAALKLAHGGNLIVVANRHLNYATHLGKWFKGVYVAAENEKFVVYRCREAISIPAG